MKYAEFGTQIGTKLAEFGSSVAFEKLTFSPITPAEGRMLAVDGGNAELFSSPTLSIQLLRFAAVEWNGRFRRQREEWELVLRKLPEGYCAELTPLSGSKAFPVRELLFADSEQVLIDGGFRGNLNRLAKIVRRVGELQFARAVAQELPKELPIVLDGNLQAGSAAVEDALTALAAEHHVIGFAKTADLFTDNGMPATAAMATLAACGNAGECWVTSPAAVLRLWRTIELRFAKLHQKSAHRFRVDTIAGQNSDSAFATLAAASSDPVFFGYPYPLIAADQLARVSNEEQEQRTMLLIVRAGKGYGALKGMANALNAHTILDRIR